MNSDSDTSSSTRCQPKVKTRFFASELSSAHDTESLDEEDEIMCDHEREDDNQDDSELYLADNDGEDFNELAAETSSLASSDSSGFVWSEQGTITAVRVRPMLPSEKKSGYRSIVDMSVNNDGLMTRIVNPTALPPLPRSHASTRYTSGKLPLAGSTSATDSTNFPAQFTQEFRFDYCYWSFDRSPAHQVATQSTIYDELGVLALQTVLQGHNCSIFSYGQPGAGKTYTMIGNSGERTSLPASASASDVIIPSGLAASERRGLIPRICQGLFADIGEGKSSDISCTVIMSYVEIYDERVYDLLSQATIKKSLKVREHPEDGAFVERARREHVTSYEQILELLEEGNRTRSVSSTHNSCRPTRSHTVLILSLAQSTLEDSASMSSTPRKSKICLVDLAGSERVDHSGASSLRLREAASVNRSLATLADVVGALAKRKMTRSVDGSQHQKTFVPYRNSVLTRLLKVCLGGRAKTIMIGAISPCCAHYEESIATLRYIERARSVYSMPRLLGDTSEDTRLLDDASELKSSFRASKDVNFLPTMCCGAPEHHEECLDCGMWDQRPSNDIPAEVIPTTTNAQETKTSVERPKDSACDQVSLEMMDNYAYHGQTTGLTLRKSVHVLNLVAIRHRWQTLRKFRALNRWRNLVSTDASSTQELQVQHEQLKPRASNQRSPTGRKAGCPPLHTRSPAAETRTLGCVQDVVAAVVTTDTICCSVVQDFLFPHNTNAPELSSAQRSSTTASATLLEVLASSSEFDRSDFLFDLSGDCSDTEHQLDKLASPENWYFSKDEALDVEDELPAIGGTTALLSNRYQGEASQAHSALSLCVDSIDMARRALGPGLRNLLSRNIASSTGVECELIRHLDKRFVLMTRHLESLMTACQSQPDDNSPWTPSRSCCETLETMVGEFCLQIIARLCDQLPSASSACVAGRLQLETQLEHFSHRLKRNLLPELARFGCEGIVDSHAVFFVATDLLLMTERIKLVWNLSGHRKRERLLQVQVLEAAGLNDRKTAARIAVLEERNAELSARCEALVATSTRPNEPRQNRLELKQLEFEYDGVTASKPEDNLGAKLAVEVAMTLGVQARNDELLCRLATLNRALAAASARVTALEAENSRLSASGCYSITELSENDSADNPVQVLRDRAAMLQKELEMTHCHVSDLENNLVGSQRITLEQKAELESVNGFLSTEKKDRKSVEAELVLLRTRTDAQIREMRSQLTVAKARSRELEAAAAAKENERWRVILMDIEAKNAELSTSLIQAKAELRSALERACQAESDSAQHFIAVESLKMSLINLQTQREWAEMLAEDVVSKHTALMDEVLVQANQVCASECRAHLDKQHLQELKLQIAAAAQDRDEHVLLLSQTEGALVIVLERESVLQGQLQMSSAIELEEMNRVRGDLHEATLEIASLREELTELLDHSTLQSATIETLKLEQAEAINLAQELELERDEAVHKCQAEQASSEHKEGASHAAVLDAQNNLSRLKRQQEIERQESMAMHETLQRQTEVFCKLQTQQHSIKMNYCSTIRDLKTQGQALSAASRSCDEKLAAKSKEMEAACRAADVQIMRLTEKANVSESQVHEREKVVRKLAVQLQEVRVDLNASTRRWIRAETQCGLLRVYTTHLNHVLTELKEACRMQLADAESSQLEKDSRLASTQVSCETDLAVSEHLSSVDAWFDELISGNMTTAEYLSAQPAPESIDAKEDATARDEDSAARSSLLKTLTDLSALTTELLVVCESTSDPDIYSNNSSAQDPDPDVEHHGMSVAVDLQSPSPHQTSPNTKEAGDTRVVATRNQKASSEVTQLRKIVMKLKEALDAKDDMLLFLDGKVRRLEQLVQQ